MAAKYYMQKVAIVLGCLLVLSACSGQRDENRTPTEIQETEAAENVSVGESAENIRDKASTENVPGEVSETESGSEELYADNTIAELYAGGNVISVTKDTMTAQVSPQDFLTGSPILYNRFEVDGWIFEWLISDNYDDDNWFSEDGVLLVSREGNPEDVQIIHAEAKGGGAVWVSAEDKFEYADVNFDNLPDLLICTGQHGNQGLLTYYCFLQTEDGFAEAPTFTQIPNPAVDADQRFILSQWRNSAASHSWAEYKCVDNTYVLYRELREDPVWDSEEDIWVWTVNGEEIGRSDTLSDEEIDNLLYNENSEWNIAGDRWQTLYNDGLTIDYSIYEEP